MNGIIIVLSFGSQQPCSIFYCGYSRPHSQMNTDTKHIKHLSACMPIVHHRTRALGSAQTLHVQPRHTEPGVALG